MDTSNQYGTLKIQQQLLELLKAFDAFCLREGIKYSVSSGTLLGAVRHKGFIPWDDDIDCIMDRTNLRKFQEALTRDSLLHMENDPELAYWVRRVRFSNNESRGKNIPTIDVFVLDNCPDNGVKAKIKLLAILMLQGMMKYHLSLEKGSFFMKCCSLATFVLGRCFTNKFLFRIYNKIAQWGNSTPSACYSIYHDQYKALRFKYPREIMQEIVRMDFENTKVNGFKEYDSYLRIIIPGDYMTPPSVEQRRPIHIG